MNRLEAIVSLIDRCDTVADIGTDHGHVATMLLEKRLCNKIIATDINEGPLNSARKNIAANGFNDTSEFRLGSGLTVLNENEADVAVIAGMGGELIAKILDDSRNITQKLDYIIIQPMTNIDTIRRYIYENNMVIEKEIIVKEYHFYYFIMKIVNKNENVIKPDDIYFTVSKYLFDKKDDLLLEYIYKLYKNNNTIISNLKNSKKDNAIQKILSLEKQNEKLKHMIECYEGNNYLLTL